MYYKTVNRGLSFTKPGIYTFGLLLLVGMIAVATGINGLYVFLAAGMGGFIVSGLLSERAMKSVSVEGINGARADRLSPFKMAVGVRNNSNWFAIFGMDTLVMTKSPKHKLISSVFDAEISVHSAWLPPAQSGQVEGFCRGMPRGVHTSLLTVQKTTFPFGILEKFKVVQVPSRVVVAPRVDQAFLETLTALLARLRAELAEDREFYCHRAYFPRDARRDVDWKKSASRADNDWVVKQFKPLGEEADVVIDAPWSVFASAPAEAEYEARLDRLRTLAQGLSNLQVAFVVVCAGTRIEGLTPLLDALAGAPAFSERQAAPSFAAHAARERSESRRAFATIRFDGTRAERDGEAA